MNLKSGLCLLSSSVSPRLKSLLILLYKVKNLIPEFQILLILFLLQTPLKAQTTNFEIEKKKIELKSYSLFNRIINSIEIRAHAGFGAGYFLSQFDPINPIYSPYAIRDRFSISITLNISKILDNSTYKIKQLELKALEEKQKHEDKQREIKLEKLKEQISLLNEQIKLQSKIVELYELNFNKNIISIDKLLDEKMKLLELKSKLTELTLELLNP